MKTKFINKSENTIVTTLDDIIASQKTLNTIKVMKEYTKGLVSFGIDFKFIMPNKHRKMFAFEKRLYLVCDGETKVCELNFGIFKSLITISIQYKYGDKYVINEPEEK